MILSQFVFFNENSTKTTSNIFSNPQQANSLTIQVSDFGAGYDNLNLEVYGGVDMTEESMYKLKVISLENFKTTTTINKAGIYLCIISGVANVRMECNNPTMLGGFKAFTVSMS